MGKRSLKQRHGSGKRARRTGLDLSGYTIYLHTIPPHISPSRVSLWQKKLTDAKARVVMGGDKDSDSKIDPTLASQTSSDVATRVVVTTREGTPDAHTRMQTLLDAELNAFLVTYSWVIDALLFEHVPHFSPQYQVQAEVMKNRMARDGSAVETEMKTPAGTAARPSSRTMLRPIWNPIPGTQTRTSAQKQAICARLPEWMMCRQTINSALFKSPNYNLISALRLLAKKRELLGSSRPGRDDGFKALAYRKAAAAVAVVPFDITSALDVKMLRYVGHDSSSSIYSHIEQFFAHYGKIPELELFDQPGPLASACDLTKVYGISVSIAAQLFEWHRGKQAVPQTVSIDDARQYFRTHPAPVGVTLSLEHYEALQQPLTSGEANEILRRVEAIAAACLPTRDLRFLICGGFRRGAAFGHDVDILYRHKDENCTESVLEALVSALEQEGLVIARLRGQSDMIGAREMRFKQNSVHHGQCDFLFAHDTCLCIARTRENDGSAGKACRVDFVGVRQVSEWAYAVMSWTGAALWQRDIRRYANSLGMVFNSHGIFSLGSMKRVKEVVPVRSEMDVFHVLNLPYTAPFERCDGA
jgi:DNA polymerase/3'-5' exonuclease PolX